MKTACISILAMSWSEIQRKWLAIEKQAPEGYIGKNRITCIDQTVETKVDARLKYWNDKQYSLRIYLPQDFANSRLNGCENAWDDRSKETWWARTGRDRSLNFRSTGWVYFDRSLQNITIRCTRFLWKGWYNWKRTRLICAQEQLLAYIWLKCNKCSVL